jgi:ApaG protein
VRAAVLATGLPTGFAERFDGFSIGSNDLTRLTLGVDRDSDLLAHLFDERNPAVTRSIEVVVTPRFIADRSSPEDNYFFWAYTIAITNHGAETVQLKTRHWRITDANGRRQEVRGAGVVGEEPVLKAGESFEYTSGVPLQTPSGFMAGVYGMVSASGENFEIEIPAFSLDSGNSKRTIN